VLLRDVALGLLAGRLIRVARKIPPFGRSLEVAQAGEKGGGKRVLCRKPSKCGGLVRKIQIPTINTCKSLIQSGPIPSYSKRGFWAHVGVSGGEEDSCIPVEERHASKKERGKKKNCMPNEKKGYSQEPGNWLL